MPSGRPIRTWSRVALCGLLCLTVGASAEEASTKNPTKSSTRSSPKSSTKASKTSSTAHPGSVKRSKSKASTAKQSAGKHSSGKTKGKRKRGQQAIDSPRARQIQEALIRQHYLEGQPSGKWDDATQAAMRRYQAAQGWQSKIVPDSRALIKLGLGPSKEKLLNPESAMTATPAADDAKVGPKQQPGDPAGIPASENKPQQ